MSTQDFDNLTAALADRSISRGRALRLAAAVVLGAAGLGVASEARAQVGVATHNECPRRGSGCCRRCRHTGAKRCVCVRHINGERHCVHQCCPVIPTECDQQRDCPSGQVCVRKANCGRCSPTNSTTDQPGVCMFRCAERTPPATECVQYRCG